MEVCVDLRDWKGRTLRGSNDKSLEFVAGANTGSDGVFCLKMMDRSFGCLHHAGSGLWLCERGEKFQLEENPTKLRIFNTERSQGK